MKPEGLVRCHQTLFFRMGSGHETLPPCLIYSCVRGWGLGTRLTVTDLPSPGSVWGGQSSGSCHPCRCRTQQQARPWCSPEKLQLVGVRAAACCGMTEDWGGVGGKAEKTISRQEEHRKGWKLGMCTICDFITYSGQERCTKEAGWVVYPALFFTHPASITLAGKSVGVRSFLPIIMMSLIV